MLCEHASAVASQGFGHLHNFDWEAFLLVPPLQVGIKWCLPRQAGLMIILMCGCGTA